MSKTSNTDKMRKYKEEMTKYDAEIDKCDDLMFSIKHKRNHLYLKRLDVLNKLRELEDKNSTG